MLFRLSKNLEAIRTNVNAETCITGLKSLFDSTQDGLLYAAIV
jgi:hypothetical protein